MTDDWKASEVSLDNNMMNKEDVASQLELSTAPHGAPLRTKTTKDGFVLVPQPSDDPRDPLNWSGRKKWTLFAVMIYGLFCGISTAVANNLATPVQAVDWEVTPREATYSISCVLAGIIVGPFIAVPISRCVGVMSCCFWSAVGAALTSIWSALSVGPNGYGSALASRFIAGCFCSNIQVFTGGIVTSIFFLHQRGKAYSIYSACYLLGQVFGPLTSGYIVNDVEWPVCFWWTVGANALAALLLFIVGDDTNWDRENDRPMTRKPMPEGWFARRRALFFFGQIVAEPNRKENAKRSLYAMVGILISPVSVLVGFLGLIFSGWFVMMGVQVPLILTSEFGFTPQGVSNLFLSAWIAAMLCILYGLLVNDRLPRYLQKRNNGIWKPEYRLHTGWFPCVVIGPLGSGIFGWAVYTSQHWAILAVGMVGIVFASVISLSAQTNYSVEIWKGYSQEVNAAINVYRIFLTLFTSLFYEPWVDAVGANWVWGTAAFTQLFAWGLVVIVIVWGPTLRKYSVFPETIEVAQKLGETGQAEDVEKGKAVPEKKEDVDGLPSLTKG